MALVAAEAGGGGAFTKNSRGSGSEESGMSSGTFGWSLQMLCLNT